MGQVFVKAPISGYFVVGYCIGFPAMWLAPDEFFEVVRARLFPRFEKLDLKIRPETMRTPVDENKIIDRLVSMESNKDDQEYLMMRKDYTIRMNEYAKFEEQWYEKRKQKKQETGGDLGEIALEYEAVQNLNIRNKTL